MRTKSDFGAGFFYCLNLYAQHVMELNHWTEEFKRMEKCSDESFKFDHAISMWANGAQDHLYGLEIPEKYKGTEIGRLSKQLKEIMQKLRYYGWAITSSQVDPKKTAEELAKKAIKNLNKIFFLLDQEVGANPVKAIWE